MLIMKKRIIIPLTLVAVTLIWLVQLSAVIAAPQRQGQDIALITAPANNAVVGGTVQIIGTADHPSFQFYIQQE